MTFRSTIESIIEEENYNIDVLWETVEKQKNRTHLGLILCKNCNTSQFRQIDNLRNRMYRCNTCLHLDYKKQLELQGFKLLEVSRRRSSTTLTLQCKIGHIKEIQSGNLKYKTRCDECTLDKYKRQLNEFGCELIETFWDNSTFKVRFKTPLGNIKSIQTGALATGEWSADDTYWETPASLYCFEFYSKAGELAEGYYFKIGISKNPIKRLKDLKLTEVASITILGNYPTLRDARRIEASLHSLYKYCRISPEIASIYTRGLNNGKYFKGIRLQKLDGITEWFYSNKSIIKEIQTCLSSAKDQ